MSSLEPIEIKIILSGTYWKDKPQGRVFINDTLIFDDAISDKIDLNWSGDLPEGENSIIVELYGKDKHQTVLEDGKIVKDQLLNIEDISFDEISIGNLKHTLSEYDHGNNCVNLGINGRWTLKFKTPIYIWLLENL